MAPENDITTHIKTKKAGQIWPAFRKHPLDRNHPFPPSPVSRRAEMDGTLPEGAESPTPQWASTILPCRLCIGLASLFKAFGHHRDSIMPV